MILSPDVLAWIFVGMLAAIVVLGAALALLTEAAARRDDTEGAA